MADTRPNDGLFSQLNGRPAHIMIIAGLVLLLGAPLIPSFKNARVARAQSEFSQIGALMELDLEELQRAQERERKDDQELAQRENKAMAVDYATMTPAEITKRQVERQSAEEKRAARERDRQTTFEDKKEDLQKKYDSNDRKKALLEAQIAATGMRWHRVLLFLGNLMLLVGLLVITLESDGMRQKVALIILLVAMFSALSGVSVNFLGAGSLGESPNGMEQFLKSGPGGANWQP